MPKRSSRAYKYSYKGYTNPADITEKQLRTVMPEVSSFAALGRAFNVTPHNPGKRDLILRVRALGIDTSHFKVRLPSEHNGTHALDLADILKRHAKGKSVPMSPNHLVARLISETLFENRCSDCGQPPVWQGRPLFMRLHHIDGDARNLEIENLAPLCPNCYTQLEKREVVIAQANESRRKTREQALMTKALKEHGGVAESG